MNFDLRDSISAMVADDLDAAESAWRPQQVTIYHYTDVKGALGILKSGELWFTERTHLNDTSEMTYGLGIARKLFDDLAKKQNPPLPEVEGFHFSETHQRRLEQFGYWVFSGSLNDNDLGQWQRYADDGRGVCLGFSLQKLIPMFETSRIKGHLPHVIHARHFGVSYCTSRLRTNMQRYIDLALDALKGIDLPPENDAAWSDEQEVFSI